MSDQKSDKPVSSSSNTSSASTSQAKHPIESESSDTDNAADFSRLSDLLQSRGLPSHIVNAFGSKVHQFIHRTMSSGMSSRYQSLISSLQQTDESIKLGALTEISQLLVMSNEDTLVGFPIKQAVPLILQCMSAESENFDLMNHACRTLTYMMDSLPRSTSIIAESVATFLQKLQVIQCMDVAEQSLTALEILSRRHSKQILNATSSGGVSACLMFLDFFSIAAQRNALQITANCCQNMITDEFASIKPSLSILSQRLQHSDKKSVESVCTVFARLVENFQHNTDILNEIAQHSVLQNLIKLLMNKPPLVSSSMLVTILHTIYLMCSNCNNLAVILVENSIEQCLKQLLIGADVTDSTSSSITGSDSSRSATQNADSKQIELASNRSPQELYEIVCIIGEILPRLPHDDIFSIDEILRKSSAHDDQNESVVWHWKDENDIQRPYTQIDSRIIEAAFVQEEDECILNTMGRTYVIDFNSMLQINEETGTARPVTRKLIAKTQAQQSSNQESVPVKDTRMDYMVNNAAMISDFISSLFKIVYEIYNSSAGPSIKHRSLRTLLRMIYFACTLSHKTNDTNNNSSSGNSSSNEQNLLNNLLSDLPISSHIAAMLANKDTKIIVIGMQIADLLLKHLPDVFSVYFYREGVVYQVDKLIESYEEAEDKEARKTRSKTKSGKLQPQQQQKQQQLNSSNDNNNSQMQLKTNRKLVNNWIVNQAKKFKEKFSNGKVNKSQLSILDQLSKLSNQLEVKESEHNYLESLGRLAQQLKQADISSFEMINSNLIVTLLNYLSVDEQSFAQFNFEQARLKLYSKMNLIKLSYLNDLQNILNNELNCLRLKQFLSVFAAETNFYYFFDTSTRSSVNDGSSFSLLVSKLHNCVNQLEQFSIRVHDVPNSIGSGKNALKFFSTHQIKCMLERHASVSHGLREWKGGHVKVDPLALVATIEKYLLMRGIHKSQQTNSVSSSMASSSDKKKQPTKPQRAKSERESAPSTSKQRRQKPDKTIDHQQIDTLSDLNPNVEIEQDDLDESTFDQDNDNDDDNDNYEGNDIDDDDEDLIDDDEEDDDDEHIIDDNLDDEDLIDDEDMDEEMDAVQNPISAFFTSTSRFNSMSASGGARGLFSSAQLPKIELLINDQVLPSNMTIYQAIKQFNSQEVDNDTDNSLLSNAIWSKVHLIHYRLASKTTTTATTTTTSLIMGDETSSRGVLKEKSTINNNKIQQQQQQQSVISDLNADLTKTHFYSSLKNKKLINEDKCLCAIRVLGLLNKLNRFWFKLFDDCSTIGNEQTLISSIDLCNQKLSAKANRQLQDPLIVMTGHLPKWLPELINEHTFLFPFETRLMYFYQSYLDRDRAMQKLIDQSNHQWREGESRYKPRLAREKRTVNRDLDLVKQADGILSEFVNLNENRKSALLEIQYENEVGTGLGPTLEFYALVSKEIQKCEHEMWRGKRIKTNNGHEYFNSEHGLYPAPIYVNPSGKQSSKLASILNKQKQKFKFLGRFMAKAAQDFRVLDIHLSPVFYKWLSIENGERHINEHDLRLVDEQLYTSVKSLREYVSKRRALLITAYKHSKELVGSFESDLRSLEKEVADLELDFTLPGHHNFELVKGGRDKMVTLENLDDYIRLVVEWTLIKGVQAQIESFRDGFESILPLKSIRAFYPDEMDRFFCGSSFKQWDTKTLIECTRCDHGYTHDSLPVKYLFEVMSQFESDEQRMFLQFVTGSPRLPIGGLSSLTPALTIVKKTMDTVNTNSDNYLPSVMTCVNYFKLPEYSSVHMLKEKLFKAMKDGQLSFHLS